MEYERMQPGDTFLRWNGGTYQFDPDFEGVDRKGVNAYDGADLIGSITWSDEGDFLFLLSAYVHPSYQHDGIFSQMFQIMLDTDGIKFVDGEWRWGGPLEKYMERYNKDFFKRQEVGNARQ